MSAHRFFAAFLLATAVVTALSPVAVACGEDTSTVETPAHTWNAPGLPAGYLF